MHERAGIEYSLDSLLGMGVHETIDAWMRKCQLWVPYAHGSMVPQVPGQFVLFPLHFIMGPRVDDKNGSSPGCSNYQLAYSTVLEENTEHALSIGGEQTGRQEYTPIYIKPAFNQRIDCAELDSSGILELERSQHASCSRTQCGRDRHIPSCVASMLCHRKKAVSILISCIHWPCPT